MHTIKIIKTKEIKIDTILFCDAHCILLKLGFNSAVPKQKLLKQISRMILYAIKRNNFI